MRTSRINKNSQHRIREEKTGPLYITSWFNVMFIWFRSCRVLNLCHVTTLAASQVRRMITIRRTRSNYRVCELESTAKIWKTAREFDIFIRSVIVFSSSNRSREMIDPQIFSLFIRVLAVYYHNTYFIHNFILFCTKVHVQRKITICFFRSFVFE